MIIGIDLDDTITDVPELFSLITRALITDGHEVHIITYREPGTEKEVQKDLEELGIGFTRIHLPDDFYSAPEWKAGLAEELKLDAMFEDSPEVLARMPKSVKRFWLCDPEIFDLDVCLSALKK